ncbi:MAG: alpha/beta hydrolase [Planctomycetota bacterium]|nr:alpha/beta hydrolase [Planctomycetota bacterium]
MLRRLISSDHQRPIDCRGQGSQNKRVSRGEVMNFLVLLLTCIAWTADVAGVQETPSFEGRWYGMAHMEDGPSVATLVEAEDVKGDWVLRITQLVDNRNHQPVLNSQIHGSSVTIKPHIGDVIQEWTGELVDSGNTYRGEIKEDRATIGSFELDRVQSVSDIPTSRTWVGDIIVPGHDFEHVRLHLVKTPEGWSGDVDLPSRHCSAYPVNVEEEGATLQIDIPTQSPIQLKLISPQPLQANDAPQEVMASWEQAGTTTTFLMEQWQGGQANVLGRPQEPRGPLPYETQLDVALHPIGHEIGVTITKPRGEGDHPAVVLVSGAGGRDRDDRDHGHRYQAVWADVLARRGIASLRFDDRGIGSTRLPEGTSIDDLTAKDQVIDVRFLAEWLGQQPGIDGSKVGVLGWGDGGLVAMRVAMGMYREVSFVVLLSTPGLPGIDMAKESMRRLLKDAPVNSNRARAVLIAYGILLDVAADPEASDTEIREVVRRYLVARSKLPTGTAKPISDQAVEHDMQRFASPAFRQSLRFDPRQILPRLRCPVLAVGGTEDRGTPVDLSLPHIEAAVQRTGGDVTVIEIANVNHRLQPVDDKLQGNQFIRATVDPRALRAVTDWILSVTQPTQASEAMTTP